MERNLSSSFTLALMSTIKIEVLPNIPNPMVGLYSAAIRQNASRKSTMATYMGLRERR
ncbi:MAG: hypothetical protein RBT68_15035 [Spirochaetia bacterium]|nr:hypothetical protein [Spirochaetia bacterium]